MKTIDLKTIPETGKHQRFRMEPRDWRPTEEADGVVELAGPLMLEADLQRAGSRILLKGHLQGDVRIRCDRCLDTFERHVDTRFQTFFPLPKEGHTDEEVELEEEDLDVAFTQGEELDVLELIREQVLLEQPMKRLCSEACKGLCPRCGKNLNEEPCGCPARSGHPAFQKLEALKSKGEQD